MHLITVIKKQTTCHLVTNFIFNFKVTWTIVCESSATMEVDDSRVRQVNLDEVMEEMENEDEFESSDGSEDEGIWLNK